MNSINDKYITIKNGWGPKSEKPKSENWKPKSEKPKRENYMQETKT